MFPAKRHRALFVMPPATREGNFIPVHNVHKPMLFVNPPRVRMFIPAQFFVWRRVLKRIILLMSRVFRSHAPTVSFSLFANLYKTASCKSHSSLSTLNISSTDRNDFASPLAYSESPSLIRRSSSSLEYTKSSWVFFSI